MRTPLVAGNWKMHGSTEMVTQLLEGLVNHDASGQVETAIFPPYLFLPLVADTLNKGAGAIAYGSQNLSEYEQGAYTGEVSGNMLVELGCQYALVGHSERRTIFGETSSQVADKFIAAQQSGVTPILCVGETLEEREAGKTLEVIAEQLEAVTGRIPVEQLVEAVVAYEPVWAIGTGLTATPEQAQEVHAFIRQKLGEAGQKVRILYGGSVKADNAQQLFAEQDIDGALVGGASLNAEQFNAIRRAAG